MGKHVLLIMIHKCYFVDITSLLGIVLCYIVDLCIVCSFRQNLCTLYKMQVFFCESVGFQLAESTTELVHNQISYRPPCPRTQN